MDLLVATSDIGVLQKQLQTITVELERTEHLYKETELRASAIARQLYQELVRAKQDADAALAEPVYATGSWLAVGCLGACG